ncbi:MAG TPA: S41 family peptidase, partial [Clostridia bacterium]|nr:S41 family peptidase [Clostridia bacterium]
MTLLGTQQGASAESQASAPDFKEVYDLVRTHLAGVNETELNRTAVEALVSALSPKVSLVGGNSGAAVTNAETSLVTKSNLFDGPIGYVRIGKVGDGLPAAVREACRQAGGTNKLTGLVLDLRYSSGQDYDAAAQTADLFLAKERP